MSKELYDRVETANQFTPERHAPQVDRQEQSSIGMDWAARQQHRPQAEPVATMPPIVPVAS